MYVKDIEQLFDQYQKNIAAYSDCIEQEAQLSLRDRASAPSVEIW